MPVIEIDDVWKTYSMGTQEVHALRGCSLAVERPVCGYLNAPHPSQWWRAVMEFQFPVGGK